ANTAEARRSRAPSAGSYTQPVQVARPSDSPVPAAVADATPAAYSPAPATAAQVTPAAHSTSTAQGVANIMAASNSVGHWGGNSGYEGCGCGATPQAAY